MKLLKLVLLSLFLFPQFAFAAYTVPLSATTTTGTIFAFPTVVNSTNPILMSPSFFGSSTVATTTILNKTNHFGPIDCGPGGLVQGNLSGLEYCNNDNTDAGGVQLIVGNPTRGSNAWVGVTMNNDQADATLTHFAGLYYNSSIYTSTFFGGLFGFPSLTAFQNTDGPLLLLSSTSTKSKAFIEMGTGGLGSTSIGFILDGNLNVGLSTSTPGSRLSVQGNEFIAGNITSTSTTASIFPYASTTMATFTTASTSNLTVSNIAVGAPRCLQIDSTGIVGVAATTCGAGGTFPFDVTLLNSFATTTDATNTSIWTKGVFISSSTVQANQFPYASSTMHSMTIASTTSFYDSGAPNALALMGVDGLLGKYGGAAGCTNQVVTAISSIGGTTCTTVSDAMLASTFVKTLTVTTGQGVSGSFSAGATPALSLTLGALTGVTSFNGLVVTANTGVITTGTWNGTAIAEANGGTNATSIGANMLLANNGASTIVSTSTPTMAGFFATSTSATSTIAGSLTAGTTTQNVATPSVLTISTGLNGMGGLDINTWVNNSNALVVVNNLGQNVFHVDTTATTPGIVVGTSTGATAQMESIALFGNIPLNNSLFQVASSSQSATTTLFNITSYGDIITKGTVPTIGGPGTQTISATSTDMRGTINMTVNGATVNVVFSRPKSDTPTCITSDDSTALPDSMGSASTTGFSVKTGATFTGNIFYICLQ